MIFYILTKYRFFHMDLRGIINLGYLKGFFTMKKKLAIVGLGHISKYYALPLSTNPNFELSAVCDLNPNAISRSYFKDVPFFEQYKDLITIEGLQSVIIATPASTHFLIASFFLSNKISVILEKPATLNQPHLEALYQLASKHGVRVDVLLHWEYGDEVIALESWKEELTDIRKVQISIKDPNLEKARTIKKEKHSYEGTWFDSGINALSMIYALLPSAHIEHKRSKFRYDNLMERSYHSTHQFKTCKAKVKVDIAWTKRTNYKVTRVWTRKCVFVIDHTKERILRNGKIIYRSNSTDRMQTHYTNMLAMLGNLKTGDTIVKRMHQLFFQASKDPDKNRFKYFIKRFFIPESLEQLILFLVVSALVATGFILLFNFFSFLETTISVVIGTIIGNLAINIYKFINTSREDARKVNVNHDLLLDIYDEVTYKKEVPFKNGVRSFVYDDLITTDDDTYQLIFEDRAVHDFKLDSIIENNYVDLIHAHKTSYFKNSDTIRLDDLTLDQNKIVLHTSRSTYFNHMVTNRAIDYRINNRISLRGIYEYGPLLTPLKESKMSNHLGIGALVYLSDGYVLFPRRSRSATTSKHKITTSLACRLKLPNGNKLLRGSEDICNVLQESLKERLGIGIDRESDMEITLLGIGRDLYEGGKPHLYYKIQLHHISSRQYCDYLKTRKVNPMKIVDADQSIYVCDPDEIMLAKNNRLTFKLCENYQNAFHKKSVTSKVESSFYFIFWHEYMRNSRK